MTALLTNPTGLECQIKWLWQGHFRYVNNLYIPDTVEEDWQLSDVMNAIENDSDWISSLRAAQNEECRLLSIQGRIRGRPDAGTTQLINVNQLGLVVGDPTPSWLTINLRQIPDNANRLIVSGTPTPFKPGRMAMPGLTDVDIEGNTLGSAATALWQDVADNLMRIVEGTNPQDSPAFSLAMTRLEKLSPGPEFPPILRAKANVLTTFPANIGTQLTAR